MSGRASRHGRRVADQIPEPVAVPWERDTDVVALAPGAVDLVCRHGSGSGDLAERSIGRFVRSASGSPSGWWLDRAMRSAEQGPRKGRQPGSWTFTCPDCREPTPVRDRTAQGWLDVADGHGVSVLDLWTLTH